MRAATGAATAPRNRRTHERKASHIDIGVLVISHLEKLRLFRLSLSLGLFFLWLVLLLSSESVKRETPQLNRHMHTPAWDWSIVCGQKACGSSMACHRVCAAIPTLLPFQQVLWKRHTDSGNCCICFHRATSLGGEWMRGQKHTIYCFKHN